MHHSLLLILKAIFSAVLPNQKTQQPLLLITDEYPAPFCHDSEPQYFGTYGRPLKHIYALKEDCVPGEIEPGSISVTYNEDARLVWLQDAGVEPRLRNGVSFADDIDQLLEASRNKSPMSVNYRRQGQHTFNLDRPGLGLVHRSNTSAIVAVDPLWLPYIDSFLPKYVSPVTLPSKALISAVPVPPEAVKRVQVLLKGLRFNPDIASIVSTLSVDTMRAHVRHLTGEDGKGILSRHSFSQGARDAANWIQAQIEDTGASCTQENFLEGFSPNVVCKYKGTKNTSSLVLLSAHYDSRGTFGSTRAPGGNDDGSGTIHLLSLARSIKENSITFHSDVELVAFAGEEQGLLGSHAHARKLADEMANVTLMIQADMLAYRSPSEPAQLGLPDLIGLPEAAWLVANVSKIYSPELTVGSTPACCSDHQSFHALGFPSTQVYERAGPIVDPMYHNSGDISDRGGYDLQQVRSIAKVTFATLLEAAGFDWIP